MAETYDIIIIGGGAAGFSAGMYAARDGCQTVLLERFSAGGQVLNCEHIENYPGFPDGVAGYSLGPLLQQQAMSFGMQMQLTEVASVRLEGDDRVVVTDAGELRARALIVATGSRFTSLDIPGEEDFAGKGVSHCASCDGAFFIDKPVVVVGGGDAAVDEGCTSPSTSPRSRWSTGGTRCGPAAPCKTAPARPISSAFDGTPRSGRLRVGRVLSGCSSKTSRPARPPSWRWPACSSTPG